MEEKESKMITKIDENLFEVFWDTYGFKLQLNKEFIKKVFLAVDLRYKTLIANSTPADALLKNISVYDIINYICAEHHFHKSIIKEELKDKLETDENYFNQLVNICYDKLMINEFRNIDSRSIVSKYNVETSLLEMFANKMLILLGQLKISQTLCKQKLQADIFAKCFMLIKSTISQLCDGLETEAMSSWRTLHELLCVLCVVTKGDENVSKAYFRHLKYGSYNRGEISDENEVKQIVEAMEKDMLELQVKKANKEKFINYGWIHWAFKRYHDEEVKMNFLGGLQKVADLTSYKKFYEIASDVTHSTPLLVYANKMNLTTTTLKITYEQFFILETMFVNYCVGDLKIDPSTHTAFYDYLMFRKTYKPKVELIYQLVNSNYTRQKN